MGIIFRQTLKSSIYSYAGVLVGFITSGVLMPEFLSTSEIGVIRQIQYYALFISSILTFGLPQSVIKLFPHFKSSEHKNFGLFTLISLVTLISTIIFLILFHYFGTTFLKADIAKSSLFARYYYLIAPFTIATLLFTIFDSYATANKESTIGVFLKDFVLRVLILALLSTYILSSSFGYDYFIIGNTLVQYIPVLFLLLFLFSKKLLPLSNKISFPSKSIKSQFISVSKYGWINVLSSVAVVTIDSIMLSKLTNSAAVGIYTTVTFYAGLMLIANKSLGKITASVVAEKFKNNQLEDIKSIYNKSALSLFILGLFLFCNLIIAIPVIFHFILPPEFSKGTWVLIILGFANLVKMSTGVKYVIISNSKHYRWTTVFFSVFVLLIVLTNLYFIPEFGITGAALASLIATTIFHLIGLVFVKVKFDLWPLDFRFFKLSVAAVIIAAITYLLPNFDLIIATFILKSALFSLLYFAFIIKSNISPEINGFINKWKF